MCLLPLFKKEQAYEIALLSVCLHVYSPYQILNAWTSLYVTWHAYHDTWAHLNGVLRKSLPSLCVSMFILLSLLGKRSVNTFPQQWIPATKEELLDAPFLCGPHIIKGESLDRALYPPIVARQRIGKHFLVATKKWLKNPFLCGPCRIRRK
jgi:hypothetical protein